MGSLTQPCTAAERPHAARRPRSPPMDDSGPSGRGDVLGAVRPPMEKPMNLSRRDILKGAAATLLTGATSMAIAPQAASKSRSTGATTPVTGVDELSRMAFTGAVGTDFDVRIGALQTSTLRLQSVSDLALPVGAPAPAPGKEGFSLLFTGPSKSAFPQGTYTIDHSKLGSFALFVVPVGPRGAATSYEAVINRLWP
jgi:hypothetical protein